MPIDATQIVVAGTGKVLTSPLLTAAPTDLVTAFAAGWIDLGYTQEAGVTFTPQWETTDIMAWQSNYPVRRIRVSQSAGLTCTLLQWNKTSLPFTFGGGTVSTPAAGVYKFSPAAAGTVDERELAIEWTDGSKKYRLIVPRGEVSGGGDIPLTRTGEAGLPITFNVLGTDSGDPWYLLTNDPAVNPV